jgi:hypothetical protein
MLISPKEISMETQTIETQPTTAESQWRDYVERAKQFRGTAAEFCRREGIEVSSFYKWRHNLVRESRQSSAPLVSTQKRNQNPTPSAVFAQAVLSSNVTQLDAADSKSPLPDAKWVADVIVHLLRGLK